MRIKPNLPPAQRAKYDYVAFLDEARKKWPSFAAPVLLELTVSSGKLGARTIRETRNLVRSAIKAAKGLLREDFPELGLRLEIAPLLARGSPLFVAVLNWIDDCREIGKKVEDFPLVVPPVGPWGCAPERYDAAPGSVGFGLWSGSRSSTSLPWWNFDNISLMDESGNAHAVPLEQAQIVAALVHHCWLERLGHGPPSWNDFLADSSKEPLWVAWALQRLVHSWATQPADDRDPAFVDSHLLQVAHSYLAWLRKFFHPSKSVKKGDPVRENVYPPMGIAYLDPRSLLTTNGESDLAALHRITCFVWFAIDALAAAGVAPRHFRKARAACLGDLHWASYKREHPNAKFDEICAAVRVHPRTVQRNKVFMRVYYGERPERIQGMEWTDGTIERRVTDGRRRYKRNIDD